MRRAGNIAPEQGNRSRQPTIRAPSAADLQVQAEPHPGVPLSPGTKRHSDANQQHVSPLLSPPFRATRLGEDLANSRGGRRVTQRVRLPFGELPHLNGPQSSELRNVRTPRSQNAAERPDQSRPKDHFPRIFTECERTIAMELRKARRPLRRRSAVARRQERLVRPRPVPRAAEAAP